MPSTASPVSLQVSLPVLVVCCWLVGWFFRVVEVHHSLNALIPRALHESTLSNLRSLARVVRCANSLRSVRESCDAALAPSVREPP